MINVIIAGSGKIGSLIACLLSSSGDYQVHLADKDFTSSDVNRLIDVMPELKIIKIDVTDSDLLKKYIKSNNIVSIISSLPYFLNTGIAQVCRDSNINYFDLTEDTKTTDTIKKIAEGSSNSFAPQCGLAPGIVSIIANNLMQSFDVCHDVKLRVGALPQYSSNELHYALTWSTDGLINEYGNLCYAIVSGEHATLKPLEGLESIQIDGCDYEAFNTSGGLGSLTDIYSGRVNELNYKTIRYPGHCEKINFLMNDLKLNSRRDLLKQIFENAIPKTYQDMVLIYVSVNGIKKGEFIERNYFKKIYPKKINGIEWSAIQVSTASGVCAVVDIVLSDIDSYKGLLLQESISLELILNNRFGQYYT